MLSAGLPPVTQVEEPRAFGYFLGDLLTRRIEVTIPQPYALTESRLPKVARVSAWLELDDVVVRSSRSGSSTRYRIDLKYQIIDSPTQLQVAAMPAVELHFAGGGRSLEQDIGSLPIAIAPLAPGATRTGLAALRPARAPTLLDATATKVRLLLFSVGAAVLFAYLALVQFALPRLSGRRGPFATAHRTLRTLAATPASVARHQAALRAVHRAFDATAGFRVFGEQLEEFMALHPEFRGAQDPASTFFAVSRAAFFATDRAAASPPLDGLLALTAQFKARERLAQKRAPPDSASGAPDERAPRHGAGGAPEDSAPRHRAGAAPEERAPRPRAVAAPAERAPPGSAGGAYERGA
jgi:mxaA protein